MRGTFIRITDSTLRDGSHAVSHSFSLENVTTIVSALDQAGVPVIEVSHGDGIGGSSFNYGFSQAPEMDLVAAAVDAAKQARIAVLMVPGIATLDDLSRAQDAGAEVVRLATHCSEADVSIQHFFEARARGLETVGFLMLAHTATPEKLAKQARIMVDAGCQCVYVVDSAGALLPRDAADRVAALVAEVGNEAQVGLHGHQNFSLGVANSIAAVEAGATQIDGTLCALGAGAGNSPTEILAAVFARMGLPTGVDVNLIQDAAAEAARPIITTLPWADRDAIIQGYEGVYSSFLLHARSAAERYGVPAHELLREVGRRGYVGGQEDMLIDVALELSGVNRA
jgi:4-hydroxy 2-oxovalerate aldolase